MVTGDVGQAYGKKKQNSVHVVMFDVRVTIVHTLEERWSLFSTIQTFTSQKMHSQAHCELSVLFQNPRTPGLGTLIASLIFWTLKCS